MPSYHSTINKLNTEIAKLKKDEAELIKMEAIINKKSNDAAMASRKTKVLSTITLKLKVVERANYELAKVAKKKADLAKNIATKVKQLNDYTVKQANEDSKAQKRLADAQKKLVSEQKDYENKLNIMIGEAGSRLDNVLTKNFDFFISHASEDKDSFVRPLAQKLEALGAKVFYDEVTLKIGDSLRKSIDHGLANCRFGVVVLSTSFFAKNWPERELNGLTTQEIHGKTKILPIWHKVSFDEVASYSPTLADKVALNTSLQSIDHIADQLYSLLG